MDEKWSSSVVEEDDRESGVFLMTGSVVEPHRDPAGVEVEDEPSAWSLRRAHCREPTCRIRS